MKTLISIIILLSLGLTACCQTDQTFVKPIYANGGIYFSDGSFMSTALTGTGVADWNTMINKPSTFPPSAHNHDLLYKPLNYVPTWNEITGKPATFAPSAHNHDLLYKPIAYVPTYAEITGKPAELELNIAIASMSYLPLPQKTTTEITALVIPAGVIAMVWDKTLGVVKLWNGTVWKVVITGN
jgi:hypothetical protein